MRIAYFDCFSGASGNMILGSLVDAGLPLADLERALRRLPLPRWSLHAERVHKRGLAALYLDVAVPGEDVSSSGDHPHEGITHHHEGLAHRHEGRAHRRLRDVLSILRAARFPSAVEAIAEKIYRRLAQAEARVHATSADEVVFHEVGQVDAILDIAGAAVALESLGIQDVYSSALPCGTGRIESAHGSMPSPAPATLELLRGLPTHQLDFAAEFVTPTGAAILASVASFHTRPPMRIDRIGYGSGRSDFPFPNVLRVLVGEALEAGVHERAVNGPESSNTGISNAETFNSETVVQLEANIDDMNPQLYAFVMERLFAAGALDVWTHSVGMKKGRPGIVLSVLAAPERADALASAMLAETTTIGVRRWKAQRDALPRRCELLDTSLGPVRIKIVEGPAGVRARAEYDDCRRIAEHKQMTLTDVMRTVERDVDGWLQARTQE